MSMFSERLRSAMKEAGINQKELAAKTGISKSGICQYMAGKNEPPDKRKELLANALGVSPEYFAQAKVPSLNLSPLIAAKLMGKSKEFVYQGLQEGRFPWGYAVKMGSNWSYYISPVMFCRCIGIDEERMNECEGL